MRRISLILSLLFLIVTTLSCLLKNALVAFFNLARLRA
ncbi:hypothetical protein Enr8_30090 [Blastopirellula retiformator]|uniref:Lipoprotein n=1 Tax=Blastopirellula retiformator TaxID=2527970 RepID=A0A5C5V3P2_9BACT|nr:hypothetical protein Enr8_30090 [Blastopirellula retiformator]